MHLLHTLKANYKFLQKLNARLVKTIAITATATNLYQIIFHKAY